MSDTLANLYQDIGINAAAQAAIRHYASRVDIFDTWQAEHGYAISHPNDHSGNVDFWRTTPMPEIPNVSEIEAFHVHEIVSDRVNHSSKIDGNGHQAGAYGEMHFCRNSHKSHVVEFFESM